MYKSIIFNPKGDFRQFSNIPLVGGDLRAYRVEAELGDTTGISMVIQCTRADGVTITAQGTADGGKVYCLIPNNAYSVDGEVRIRVVISSDTETLTVNEIVLNALPKIEDTVQADDRYPVLSSLIQNVQKLENNYPKLKVVTGTYTGNGTNQTVECGITPQAVVIMRKNLGGYYEEILLCSVYTGYNFFRPDANGFYISSSAPTSFNNNNTIYQFIAIGG